MERRALLRRLSSFSASTETQTAPWANLECSLLLNRHCAPANSEHLPYRCMLIGSQLPHPRARAWEVQVLDGPCSGGSKQLHKPMDYQ